jgi:hypothetical protein
MIARKLAQSGAAAMFIVSDKPDLSTNKVYGDASNEIPLRELDTCYDYALLEDFNGIDDSISIVEAIASIEQMAEKKTELALRRRSAQGRSLMTAASAD